MIYNLKFVLPILLIFTALKSNAKSVKTSAAVVSKVMVGSTGVVYVETTIDEKKFNPANCKDSYRFALKKSHPGHQTIFSLLLSAHSGRHQVVFWVEDSNCLVNSPQINLVRIE